MFLILNWCVNVWDKMHVLIWGKLYFHIVSREFYIYKKII